MKSIDYMRNNKKIGARIRRLRRQRGLSLAELSDRTLWDKHELKAVEEGVEIPLGYMDRIARALDVELDEFALSSKDRR